MATRKKSVAKPKSDVDLGPENTPSPPFPVFASPEAVVDALVVELVALESRAPKDFTQQKARRDELERRLKEVAGEAAHAALRALWAGPLVIGTNSVAPPWPKGANASVMRKVQRAYDANLDTILERGWTYQCIANVIATRPQGQVTLARALERGVVPEHLVPYVVSPLLDAASPVAEARALFDRWLTAPLNKPTYGELNFALTWFHQHERAATFERLKGWFTAQAVATPEGTKRAQLALTTGGWSAADKRWKEVLLPLAQLSVQWNSYAMGALQALGVAPRDFAFQAAPATPEPMPAAPRVAPALPPAPKFKKPRWPTPAARRKELVGLLADADLEHHADALLLPSVTFALERVKQALPVGTTRFGGCPDLPAGVAWPSLDGNPLHFVGQWALDDLDGLDAAATLPKGGLISFFVLMFPRTDAQSHCGHGVVLHLPPGKPLARAQLPANWSTQDDPRVPFAECRVHFVGSWSLPHPVEPLVKETLGDDERARYAGEEGTVYSTQLLGWRQHNGYSTQPAALRLLLQLNSDDQLGAEFGDVEDCDWFIDARALSKGNLSKVVMAGGA